MPGTAKNQAKCVDEMIASSFSIHAVRQAQEREERVEHAKLLATIQHAGEHRVEIDAPMDLACGLPS